MEFTRDRLLFLLVIFHNLYCPVENPDLVRLFEQRIKALELARNYADALKVSREMLTIANKRNSATMECAATLAQAVLFIAEQT